MSQKSTDKKLISKLNKVVSTLVEETAKMRNLSPTAYACRKFEWTKHTKRQINLLKTKHDFNSGYNLHEALKGISQHALTTEELLKQNPTKAESHEYLELVSNLATYLESSNMIAQALKTTLDKLGSKLTHHLARNMPERYYSMERIRELSSTPIIAVPGLAPLIRGCESAKAQLPPSSKGRHKDPRKHRTIQFLMNIFIHGTGKEPTSKGRDNKESDCFDFLADINELLLKPFNIGIEKESTLNQYLYEVIDPRNESIINSYATVSALNYFKIKRSSEIKHISHIYLSALIELESTPHIT